MKIKFSCSCGKSYEAAQTYAGKDIVCKSCQQPVRIPDVKPNHVQVPVVPSPQVPVAPLPQVPGSAPAPVAKYLPPSPVAGQRSPSQRKPVQYSVTAQKLMAEHARNERGQGFSAMNPGLLRPSMFMYYRHFPHRIAWRAGLLLAFAGLSFLHWAAIPFALLSAWLVVRNYREIRGQFVSGCICPARILSVNPPVIAVCSDLSMGVGSCPVIRLFELPLHRLPPMFAKPGRTSTICYFFGMYPGLSNHFFTVLPMMPHFVSHKQGELQRIYDSIPDDQWQDLELGLKQLPPNPAQRSYRILPHDHRPRLTFSSSVELGYLARKHLAQADGKFGNEIPPEALAKVDKYLPQPLDRSHVVGLCTGFGAGVVIMAGGLLYYFSDETKKPISIGWNEIKVAYGNFPFTEIITTSNQRLEVPNGIGMKLMVQMEKFINEAVGVGPDG